MYNGGKDQAKTIEKKKFIFKHLRRGKLPKEVRDMVVEEYGLTPASAEQLVYMCSGELKERLADLSNNAAEYLMNNLQALAADALDEGDKKSALKAYELIAKVTKVGSEDGKTTVDINFGFSFDDK